MQNQENKKCSTQCFCDGSCKKPQEKKLGNYNKPNVYVNSTLHKAREDGKFNKEIVGDLVPVKDSKIYNCNWTKCGQKGCNNCYPTKDDVIQNNNKAEKETMEYLNEAPLGSFGRRGKKIDYSVGKKENKNKPQISLLFKQFPQALEAIAKCSEYGHEKYKETDTDYLNYQRVYGGSKTYADAGLRHRLEQGDDLESGLPHQYHVAWNALAELQLWIQEKE